jgi:hypothetical protein
VVVDQFAVKIYPASYIHACSTVSLTSTAISDFSLDVLDAAGTAASDKTFAVTTSPTTAPSGCTYGLTFAMLFNDPAHGYIANPYSTYFSVASTTGVLTYKSPPASIMNGQAQMLLNFKIIATFDNFPSQTQVMYLKITLNNPCALSRFTNPSSQAAIYYQDGINVATSVPAFTYASD